MSHSLFFFVTMWIGDAHEVPEGLQIPASMTSLNGFLATASFLAIRARVWRLGCETVTMIARA